MAFVGAEKFSEIYITLHYIPSMPQISNACVCVRLCVHACVSRYPLHEHKHMPLVTCGCCWNITEQRLLVLILELSFHFLL